MIMDLSIVYVHIGVTEICLDRNWSINEDSVFYVCIYHYVFIKMLEKNCELAHLGTRLDWSVKSSSTLEWDSSVLGS